MTNHWVDIKNANLVLVMGGNAADDMFEDGLFSGYNEAKRNYDKTTWMYELGADGYVKTDPTLTNPRCVFNLMKAHYARYTPEMVNSITGTPKEQFLKVCEMIA